MKPQFTCAVCGQPSTIHETVVEGDRAVTRHYCQEHGAPAIPAIAFGPDALHIAEEQCRNLSAEEKEHYTLFFRRTHRSV